ncbi:MAG: toll/interleukin-1 receptor domain-containing protein [Cyanobacteria bacterium P01_F01_bin.3]
MLRLFLANAEEDDTAAVDLYNQLKQRGYRPWRRQVDILPGQMKDAAIARAVKECNVFIACFSSRSVNKPGYVQKEFRLALKEQAERPPGSVYMIPLTFDSCPIPELRQEEYSVNLRNIQWVDLSETSSFERLILTLETAFPDEHQQPDIERLPLQERCAENLHQLLQQGLAACANNNEARSFQHAVEATFQYCLPDVDVETSWHCQLLALATDRTAPVGWEAAGTLVWFAVQLGRCIIEV